MLKWLSVILLFTRHHPTRKDNTLAKPNYQYEKRQKDLAKKKKQEEKRQKKVDKTSAPLSETAEAMETVATPAQPE